MTATKRVQGLTVAAAVLSAGAIVAGPANATGAADGQSVTTASKSATTTDAVAAAAKSPRKKVKCGLTLKFLPKVGKGGKRIKSISKTKCNQKVPKIWNSVRLIQTKASNKYKKTSSKKAAKNKSVVRTFCPREVRTYRVVGQTTVKLPKSSKKKFLTIKKRIKAQTGTCR